MRRLLECSEKRPGAPPKGPQNFHDFFHGCPVSPLRHLCLHPFDAMVCVGLMGHAGPHVTSNADYPNGLPRALRPSPDGTTFEEAELHFRSYVSGPGEVAWRVIKAAIELNRASA